MREFHLRRRLAGKDLWSDNFVSFTSGQNQGECPLGMCRSKWGNCGTSPAYCGNTQPTPNNKNPPSAS
ncbi:unnamed protein product, partial [Rotaria sp. Silwood2]